MIVSFFTSEALDPHILIFVSDEMRCNVVPVAMSISDDPDDTPSLDVEIPLLAILMISSSVLSLSAFLLLLDFFSYLYLLTASHYSLVLSDPHIALSPQIHFSHMDPYRSKNTPSHMALVSLISPSVASLNTYMSLLHSMLLFSLLEMTCASTQHLVDAHRSSLLNIDGIAFISIRIFL